MDILKLAVSGWFARALAGADRYLLKNVLHDWGYDNGVRILRTGATTTVESATQLPTGHQVLASSPRA
ncbi:hypothetical protein WEB32_30860 [Streptomyces netropsis]|uniref:hypothetical protein n=1 Tax=Streptomyces netropsis TaxID=55404 RepID=UPI0030CF4C28